MGNLRILVAVVLLAAGLAACGNKKDTAAEQGKAPTRMVPATDDVVDQYVTTSREAAQKLGGALKTALQTAMTEGGPVEALNVCHDEAEVIAERICNEEGLTVGRTSRKFRNPGNAPDAWERSSLEAFDARMAAGENPADLEMWATVTGPDGSRTFRYLKAIPTGPLCLTCHGSELAPELDESLVILYPDDHARGFAVGDMRGAFTVKMDLPRDDTGG